MNTLLLIALSVVPVVEDRSVHYVDIVEHNQKWVFDSHEKEWKQGISQTIFWKKVLIDRGLSVKYPNEVGEDYAKNGEHYKELPIHWKYGLIEVVKLDHPFDGYQYVVYLENPANRKNLKIYARHFRSTGSTYDPEIIERQKYRLLYDQHKIR